MQLSTIVVLACLVAMVSARAHHETRPADAAHESLLDTPAHDHSLRTKRGLLLLKKKLLLGALGLKAAKVGALAGVAAVALKSKPKSVRSHTYYHHHHG